MKVRASSWKDCWSSVKLKQGPESDSETSDANARFEVDAVRSAVREIVAAFRSIAKWKRTKGDLAFRLSRGSIELPDFHPHSFTLSRPSRRDRTARSSDPQPVNSILDFTSKNLLSPQET